MDEHFYIISVCSNPIRYNSRYKLFKQYQTHITALGAKLIVVEMGFGERPFVVTQRDNTMHLQFRTREELWHKENMINLAINYLCQIDPDWKYVAWIDGDIHFQQPSIIKETVHALQHYDIVQMFSQVVDMGPDQQIIQTHKGFMYQYHNNYCHAPQGVGQGGYYQPSKAGFWHPGYAWAARRDAMMKLPLLDTSILGAGDHHMALALIGCAEQSLPGKISTGYRKSVLAWQSTANRYIRRNVGYVPGMITHYWHGNKKDRKYVERWDILTRNQFDPYIDLSRDEQGLYHLNDHYEYRSLRLRDEIRAYFRQRHEDSIDIS